MKLKKFEAFLFKKKDYHYNEKLESFLIDAIFENGVDLVNKDGVAVFNIPEVGNIISDIKLPEGLEDYRNFLDRYSDDVKYHFRKEGKEVTEDDKKWFQPWDMSENLVNIIFDEIIK